MHDISGAERVLTGRRPHHEPPRVVDSNGAPATRRLPRKLHGDLPTESGAGRLVGRPEVCAGLTGERSHSASSPSSRRSTALTRVTRSVIDGAFEQPTTSPRDRELSSGHRDVEPDPDHRCRAAARRRPARRACPPSLRSSMMHVVRPLESRAGTSATCARPRRRRARDQRDPRPVRGRDVGRPHQDRHRDAGRGGAIQVRSEAPAAGRLVLGDQHDAVAAVASRPRAARTALVEGRSATRGPPTSATRPGQGPVSAVLVQRAAGSGRRTSEASAPTLRCPLVSDIDIHTTAGKLADLEQRLEAAVHAGSRRAVEKQHATGKQTARERVDAAAGRGLVRRARRARPAPLDELRDGEATGRTATASSPGTARSTAARSASSRRTSPIFGGSLGEVYGEKIVKVMDLAMKTGCPLIGINEGARRAHPGGRRLARPVRRDLPPQRARLGRRSRRSR